MTTKCHIFFLSKHQYNGNFSFYYKMKKIEFQTIRRHQDFAKQGYILLFDFCELPLNINDPNKYSMTFTLNMENNQYPSENVNFQINKEANFIYDFKLKNFQDKETLSFIEQLKCYLSYLESLKTKAKKEYDNWRENLLKDSVSYLTQRNNLDKKNVKFEDFLILFSECITTKYVKECMELFSFNEISINNQLNLNNYKKNLEAISSKKEILTLDGFTENKAKKFIIPPLLCNFCMGTLF